MVAGIPSVATDCSPGGAKLISDSGKYCLLASNDDVDSLSQKITFALSNPLIMEDYAVKAKNSMSRFDKELIANKWKSVLGRM